MASMRERSYSSSLPSNITHHSNKGNSYKHRTLEPNDVRLQHLQQGQLIPPQNGSGNGYPQLSRKFVARRISEGETGRLKKELKCQACGKGYKHVSSLAKHLWEHTPEWSVTSKLLISKHQQVQLLEAASILVSMNEEDDDDSEGSPPKLEDASSDSATPGQSLPATPAPSTGTSTSENSRESSREPPSRETTSANSSVTSFVEPETKPKPADSILDHITPARDIPILDVKPIHKTPNKSGYIHRRMSSSHNAGSYASLYSSMGKSAEHILRDSNSPLPEAVIAKDFSQHPPSQNRHRSMSTYHSPNINASTMASIHARASRESAVDEDEDGLQDPHDEEHGTKNRKDTQGDVFGELEV